MFARFFVDRPIFATVISIVVVLIGLVALNGLPIAQYPEVVPPTVSITTNYPGASAKVVAETVAAPIEQEVNGVEGMLYMLSKSGNDGSMTLDVTFRTGTNLDFAQVLTQNRVAIAEAKLPEEVKRQGVTVKKKSPMILLCVNLLSPDGRYDQLYLSNYATIQVKDTLARLVGVGDVSFLGARDYSMRVWLDPNQLAARSMTASDVVNALREQNVQVAAGRIGQPPAPAGLDFQYTINTLGRLLDPEQFAQIVIKTGEQGQITRLADVGRVELGSKSYDVSSYLDGQPSVTLALYQLPGANALATAQSIRTEMDRLAKRFPPGMEYRIVYDTTVFVNESVHEVYKTLAEAFVLVFLVVLIFLQDWRATLLPMIDVPVSLVGTLAVMSVLGFSLNNLSLFGLVLAIGIVVDDAIVVVENVERWMAQGLPPREATIKALDEITGPVIAITLVLSAVFIPTAFIAGISGQFYRQFALTIAAATIISAINAMTMAPARAVTLIKPHAHGEERREALPRLAVIVLVAFLLDVLLEGRLAALLGLAGGGHEHSGHGASAGGAWLWLLRGALLVAGGVLGAAVNGPVNRVLLAFFKQFNRFFEWLATAYGRVVGLIIRAPLVALVVYAALMALTWFGFHSVPTGFIPQQDKGYLVVNIQLPDGASLERSEEVTQRIDAMIRNTPGVQHTIAVPGYSVLSATNISNVGGMFVILDPFEERIVSGRSADVVLGDLRRQFQKVQDAIVVAFGAPPVDGLGSTGGFKLQVQDRADAGFEALQGAVENVIRAGGAQPGLIGLFSSFRASQPQLYVDIDRTKAKALGVALDDVFATLQVYLGSAYVNDFTRFGRNWQVNVQADAAFRVRPEDIGALKVRSRDGKMVPLATLLSVRDTTGPAIVYHYNMFPSADVSGATAPGVSSGTAIGLMEAVAQGELPTGMGFEWTELTLQEILAGNTAVFVFAFGALLVFMVLAGQYESWSLPGAIILIVPMCLLAAITGVWVVGSDNNIFTQIGLVVLIGLAAKNAILIVEFAKQLQEQGKTRREAIVEACRTRLRPIIMTSLAFILGVVPLITTAGAGAEMRFALGIAVFSGMLGVTIFGLFFTPIFYELIRGAVDRRAAAKQIAPLPESPSHGARAAG
jgi:multidrug efflux pump